MAETVFDPIRGTRVKLTPEERVRQSVVHHLTSALGYPPELLANEAVITVGKVRRRCDTVVFDRRDRTPLMVLEYKAPEVALSEKVLTQALEYNAVLGAKVVAITNGREMHLLRCAAPGRPAAFLDAFPTYDRLASTEF